MFHSQKKLSFTRFFRLSENLFLIPIISLKIWGKVLFPLNFVTLLINFGFKLSR